MRLKITPKGKLINSPWIIIKGRSLGLTTSYEALRLWYEEDHEANYKYERQASGV